MVSNLKRSLDNLLKGINIINDTLTRGNGVLQAAQQPEPEKPSPAPEPVSPELVLMPVKKRYKRATKDISRKNIATSSEDILKVLGIGFVKEIVIVADNKINLILHIDGREFLVDRSTWDDLAAITTYSNTITARVVGSSFVLILSEFYFKKSFDMKVYFSVAANITSILGFYDVCEVWQ